MAREAARILWMLQYQVREMFAVELETIHEITTQDEVVRIVNLLAHQTATACVNEDRKQRGKKIEEDCGASSWSYEARCKKIEWSKARTLALQICPGLADRLPHFSEFEPLKSYNAEHLLQKKAKQQLQTK